MSTFDKITIESFNEYVEDLVTNDMTSLAEITDSIYDLLTSDTKWPKEATSEIIAYICKLHDKNELEANGTITPFSNEKFIKDEEFGSNVLYYYISAYLKDACVINLFNTTIIDYGMDLDKEESQMVDYMTDFLEENERRNIILKHIFKNLDIDVEEIDYNSISPDYLNAILEYYFDQVLKPDFHSLRINAYCQGIIDYDNNFPSDEAFALLYKNIIELDETYDYACDIISMLSTVEEDPNNYKKYTTTEDYGIEVLKKYFKTIFMASNKDNYIFINEIARGFLEEIKGDKKTPQESITTLNFYFQSITKEYEKKFSTLQKYNISLEEIKQVQKVCLISDYYNYNSELVFNPLWIEEISKDKKESDFNTYQQEVATFIKDNDINTLLNRFDTDDNFRLTLINTYVTNNNDYSICTDTDTLKRINPYFIVERSRNKTYQKKLIN